MAYGTKVAADTSPPPITRILAEFVVRRPWHVFLHNQTALFVKRLLLFEERAVLTSVPYTLRGTTRTSAGGEARGPAKPDRAPAGPR